MTTYQKNDDFKELTWQELADQYECPEWFGKLKFGIWAHWGPQCVPKKGGGWYARHMYMQDVGEEKWGKEAYEYHLKTYGHPSEFGFKDIINLWKAEHFDADAVIDQCIKWGARYFYVTSSHHDHFDCFDSTYHKWNSVNMGPKRDIVGEFEKAARKRDLKFCIASHDNRHWWWWEDAFKSDQTGNKKGIPYDGRLSKEDGKGKWWEGYDPRELYGPLPEDRTPELYEAEMNNWVDRHIELVEKYKPDMFYHDCFGFSYGDYGKKVVARFYNNALKETGKIDVINIVKAKEPGCLYGIECGVSPVLEDKPWQTETTFLTWFYSEKEPKHNARSILEFLVDIVSKNGNLTLSVELLPDGTYPDNLKEIMDEVGNWLEKNGEAIYETTAWTICGDGASIRNADPSVSPHYTGRTKESPLYDCDEVRFTVKGDSVYLFFMNPMPGEVKIPSLGLSKLERQHLIKAIKSLDDSVELDFIQGEDGLVVTLPKDIETGIVIPFKMLFKEK